MLPEHIMRELRYIELAAAKRIRSDRIGTYTSRQRGGGFDFDEHRAYRQGDDVRTIDWNVTARMNAPFVRKTHADRELNVMVALDLSRSMAFGTGPQSKRERMLYVAACLVFSAVADQVNTGFLAFSDRVLTFQPPRRARARAWQLLEDLWAVKPQGASTAIVPVARFLVDQLRARSIVFLVSDFLTRENLDESADLRALAVRHDVIAVVLEDPAEVALVGGSGTLTFKDLESGRRLRVALTPRLRQEYADAVGQRRRDLVDTFYRTRMEHVFLRSDQDLVQPLLRLFATRRD
jgi:uncharacterized protein (DUF58 family)